MIELSRYVKRNVEIDEMNNVDPSPAARPKPSIAVGRRSALSAIAGGVAWPLVPGIARASAGRRLFLSARGLNAEAKGGYRASGFDGAGS